LALLYIVQLHELALLNSCALQYNYTVHNSLQLHELALLYSCALLYNYTVQTSLLYNYKSWLYCTVVLCCTTTQYKPLCCTTTRVGSTVQLCSAVLLHSTNLSAV